MNYNFIKTDDVVKTTLEINNIKDDLDKEYDFTVNDEVFLSFHDLLIELKDMKFLVVGDYDCDGICSTTIIKRLLNHLNIKSNHYIPSRLKEGYGLNNSIIDKAKENDFDVIFLVDNGVSSQKEIDYARSLGIKVLIIDHHEYDVKPICDGFIHSNIVESKYRDLSAAGLSFILSLCFYHDELSQVLGGLSVLSDMMKVTDFNRFLVKKMLDILNTNSVYHINMLNDYNAFSYDDLSFNVIPKINAISRMEPMGNPNNLVKFFLEDEKNAHSYLEKINYINEKRKELSKRMMAKATGLINEDKIQIIFNEDYPEGLLGIIANRLLHNINKPVIVLTLKDGVYKGSGRSIESFNLFKALEGYINFKSFGGHEGAVGISFDEKYFDDFKKYVKSIDYDGDISKDVILFDIEDINNNLLNTIESLKPFGTGFKEPLIAIKNDGYRRILISNRFLKFQITSHLSAISFNEYHKDIDPLYIIGNLKKDTYNKDSLSITIEDLVE